MKAKFNYYKWEKNKIYYGTAGSGFPILLIHGWPQTSFMWRRLYPFLTNADYSVVMPDLPGLGKSSSPKSYDKKTISKYLQKLVHDYLGYKDIFIIGHDWGGPISFAYANSKKKFVKKIVLLDVLIPCDGSGQFSQNRWHHQFHGIQNFPEKLISGKEKLYLRYFYKNWSGENFMIENKALKVYLDAYTKKNAMSSGFEYYRSLPQDIIDNISYLKKGKLNIPILGLAGKENFGRGIKIVLDSIKKITDIYEGFEISTAGHWLAEEEPEKAAEYILNFLSKR